MRRRPPRLEHGRAIIAVVALYALLLRAFLGVAAPLPALALDPAGAVLCADHGAADGDTADGKARADCHPCCTLAQAGTLAPPPAHASAALWSRDAARSIAWRPGSDIPKTGPPPRAGTARGPPIP